MWNIGYKPQSWRDKVKKKKERKHGISVHTSFWTIMMEISASQPFYLFPYHSMYASRSYLEGEGRYNENYRCRAVFIDVKKYPNIAD